MTKDPIYPLKRLPSRRDLLKSLGFSATALALSGCGVIVGSPNTTTSALGKDPALGRKTVLEVYSVFTSTLQAGLINLAKKYEEIQSEVGIKITYSPSGGGGGSDNPKLFTSIAGNASPDVAMLTPFSTPQWVDLGTVPLSERFSFLQSWLCQCNGLGAVRHYHGMYRHRIPLRW